MQATSFQQRGAVLFIALVFLVLLTMLAIMATSSSMLQERMTGGMRSQQLGMMGAESALRGGEFIIWNAAEKASHSAGGSALPPCAGGGTYQGGGVSGCLYDRPMGREHPNVSKFRSAREWLSTLVPGAQIYKPVITNLTDERATASIASQPQILLEDLGMDTSGNAGITGRMGGARLQELGGAGGGAPPRRLYRITARSQGGNPKGAVTTVESVFSAYGLNNQFNPDAAPTP